MIAAVLFVCVLLLAPLVPLWLACGQGLRSMQDLPLLPWHRTPLSITWSWRYPTETQVRLVLADDPAACRRIFGIAP